jgi:P2 family phage contractile tail tube protein
MGSTTPQVNINYEMYLDGSRIIGTVDVTQPNLQAITAEMKGAGIAGSVEQPVNGLFQDLTGTINFRTVTGDTSKLLVQQRLHFEFWGAVQTVDPSTGQYVTKQHKIIWGATIKNNTIGNFNVGELQGRSLEYSITYLREFYDGKEVIELDKWNNKYVVNGEDMLQAFKRVVGLM